MAHAAAGGPTVARLDPSSLGPNLISKVGFRLFATLQGRPYEWVGAHNCTLPALIMPRPTWAGPINRRGLRPRLGLDRSRIIAVRAPLGCRTRDRAQTNC